MQVNLTSNRKVPLSDKSSRSQDTGMTGNDRDQRESRSRRKSSLATGDTKMAAQSQGIKKLMASEKEAAQVVANARKSEFTGSAMLRVQALVKPLLAVT